MAVTIVATPGASNANSFGTLDEANAYFESRLPLDPAWEDADSPEVALIMATRVLNAFVQATRVYIPGGAGVAAHYLVRKAWTGLPATTTQKLSWPRSGMYDFNGNAIASDVIPDALKEAQFELAGQLLVADTTLDNDIRVQGIKSVSVSSISIAFKDMIEQHVLPDAVWLLMPQSWFTDEIHEPALSALFDVVSN